MPVWNLQPPASPESLLPLWQLLHLPARSVLSSLTLLLCYHNNINFYMQPLPHTVDLAGSSSCTCMGENRAFQRSDGSCVCRTGFVFYDELDFRSSSADSPQDCQPEVR